VTLSVTDVGADCPDARLVQSSVYVSVPTAVGFTVCVPVLSKGPVQLPEAVQPWLFADDHVIVVELPTTMEFVASVNVGAAGTIICATGTLTAAISA
jgi:hypothetical protein